MGSDHNPMDGIWLVYRETWWQLPAAMVAALDGSCAAVCTVCKTPSLVDMVQIAGVRLTLLAGVRITLRCKCQANTACV